MVARCAMWNVEWSAKPMWNWSMKNYLFQMFFILLLDSSLFVLHSSLNYWILHFSLKLYIYYSLKKERKNKMKAMYDNVPSVLEAVGDGSWRYRWNIERMDEKDDKAGWQCEEATVWEPLSANKITEAVITEKFDANYEQKLVNDYNAVVLGLVSGQEAEERTERYKDFLKARAALKAKVDEVCATLKI